MPMKQADLVDWVKINTEIMNIRYFDGILKFDVTVHSRESIRWYAKVLHPAQNGLSVATMTLNPLLVHASTGELDLIVTHELVHVAQLALDLRMNHGQTFKDIVKKFGIPAELANRCAPSTVRLLSQMKRGWKPTV